MSRLEQAITNIVDVFLEYAQEDGQKKKLSLDELKKLLDEEIVSDKLKEEIIPGTIEETMKNLDKNHDSEINFREYARCVADLAKSMYHQKTGRGGKKGKGKGREGDQED